MKSFSFYYLLSLSLFFISCNNDDTEGVDNIEGVLFFQDFRNDKSIDNFDGIEKTSNFISSEGLIICDSINPVYLTRDYSLSERSLELLCCYSNNAICSISNSISGSKYIIDINRKCLIIDGNLYNVDFLEPNVDFIFSIEKNYNRLYVKIYNSITKNEFIVNMINDGKGGCGKGNINPNSSEIQMPHGFYCINSLSGETTCKSIKVSTPRKRIRVLIYGDSITETEVYYPSSSFHQSWPQLVRQKIESTVTSGFSGKKIDDLIPIMKNEIPYLDVDYVLITIGTNGGNTIENLSEMVRFLLSNSIKPILNHIPCNESDSQLSVNQVIDKVRNTFNIAGADFDLATQDENGQVDKSMMFWEDYGPDYIKYRHDYWHHPNEKGSHSMFIQLMKDVPELFIE